MKTLAVLQWIVQNHKSKRADLDVFIASLNLNSLRKNCSSKLQTIHVKDYETYLPMQIETVKKLKRTWLTGGNDNCKNFPTIPSIRNLAMFNFQTQTICRMDEIRNADLCGLVLESISENQFFTSNVSVRNISVLTTTTNPFSDPEEKDK